MGSCARAWHLCPNLSRSSHAIWKKLEGEATPLPLDRGKILGSSSPVGKLLLPPAQLPDAHLITSANPGISHRHLPSASRLAAAKLPWREDRGTHTAFSWSRAKGRVGGFEKFFFPRRGREQAGFSPRPGWLPAAASQSEGEAACNSPPSNNAVVFFFLNAQEAEISRARETKKLPFLLVFLFLFQSHALPR